MIMATADLIFYMGLDPPRIFSCHMDLDRPLWKFNACVYVLATEDHFQIEQIKQ